MKRLHKTIRTVWITAGTLFMIWLFYSMQARGFDTAVLQSDAQVNVTETAKAIRFVPQQAPATALLFYPGALVDPHAYAPLARAIAEQGYLVIIIKLPWRTASFGDQEAEVMAYTQEVMSSHERIERWFVAGHSRGGGIASRFAHQHSDLLAGLILIGTSLPKEVAFSLANASYDVTKIYATEDGLAGVAEVEANASLLPGDTQWVLIEGGNHAQFGYYGWQLGDSRAQISREVQQTLTLSAVLAALERP